MEEGGVKVLNFDEFCCGAHGLSILIETEVASSESTNSKSYTLFDTGPDSISLLRNLKALRVPVERISRVVLSHWHSDHSGGLISFLKYRADVSRGTQSGEGAVKEDVNLEEGVVVDVHPSRPSLRGIAPALAHSPPAPLLTSSPDATPAIDPSLVLCALPPDPSLPQILASGGKIEKHAEEHVVADGCVWVSGEVPRVTEWEGGLGGGVRWVPGGEAEGDSERAGGKEGKWISEPHLMDERFAVVDVEGKGLVIFSSYVFQILVC